MGAARRDEGGLMTLRGLDDDIRLAGGDIEPVRGVLVAYTQLLHWAER